MDARVSDLLAVKGSEVYCIGPEATVFEAIRMMVEHNVGALLVMDRERVVGIITERDYLRRVALEGRTSRTTLVREIMNPDVVVITPDRDLEVAMAVMTEKRVRHLPVIEKGQLRGIISIGDVVKYLSSARKAEIQYLRDYIDGRYPG